MAVASPHPPDRASKPEIVSETTRLEAFSDGVYAIAITLLVLDLKLPVSPDGHLGAALLQQWPNYFAFLLSFAFIGIMWVNHHRLYSHILRCDNGLLFLNLLLLLGITFVPFPAAVLAGHLRGADARTAAALFNGTYVVIAICFNVLWHHAVSSGLLDSATLDSARSISRQYAVGPVSYLVCFGLSWLSVSASLGLNIALAVFFALPARPAKK